MLVLGGSGCSSSLGVHVVVSGGFYGSDCGSGVQSGCSGGGNRSTPRGLWRFLSFRWCF